MTQCCRPAASRPGVCGTPPDILKDMYTHVRYPVTAPDDTHVSRLSVSDEVEFSRAVRWALHQGADSDAARFVLHGVPPAREWRQGFGDWVVVGDDDSPLVVVGRVPVVGSLLVADEFGELSQVDEHDVTWLFRVSALTPSYALIGRGAEFDQPRLDDDVAWQWCWVDSLGPSLAVKMMDESMVAVFSGGRLAEVRADRVRVALGGVPAWDTVLESGVVVPVMGLSPDQRYEIQRLIDAEHDAEVGTDRYCAMEYLFRVAYGDAR